MNSLTNFLLSVFVARSLGAKEFGAFTLAYVTYGLACNASRGIAVEPLLIRFSAVSLPEWRRATAGSTGTALTAGLVCGVCALAVAPFDHGTTGRAFLALGLTFPGLLLQDNWRFAFFALGRGYYAFINDTIWAAVQIPLFLWLKSSGHADVFWFVLAWGGSATVAAAAGVLQAKVVPSLTVVAQWVARHRDLGPRYLVENLGSNVADMLRSYSVTSILGLVAVGYIQAANVLIGPFKIILLGISIITIPEGARLLRRSPEKLPLYCAALSIGLTLLAAAWGGLLLVALPYGLGHLMLGALWRPAYPLVLPTAISYMAVCASTGALVGLHTLGASRRSMRVMLLSAALVVTGVISGAFIGGMTGSVSFTAAAACVGMVLSWRELRQALHESPQTSVPFWLWPPKGADKSVLGGKPVAAAAEPGIPLTEP